MRAGIAVDDYKVKKFKKRLKKEGYEFTSSFLFQGVTLISVEIKPEEVKAIEKICKELEIEIKRSN